MQSERESLELIDGIDLSPEPAAKPEDAEVQALVGELRAIGAAHELIYNHTGVCGRAADLITRLSTSVSGETAARPAHGGVYGWHPGDDA